MDLTTAVPALLVFIWGTAFGSFLNVVVYRLPLGLSLLHPPSRCPKCLTQLRAYENVPVLGWIGLRGRCRNCRKPIPIRYPLVEATTGFIFLWVFSLFNWPLPIIGYWLLFSLLLALALIDLDTMTLPNGLTQFGLVAGLGFNTIIGFQQISSPGWAMFHSFMVGAIGAVIGLWLFEGINFIASVILGQTAMGGGDAKLAAMIGAWLGWQLLLLASFLACALGAFLGSGAIALKLRKRRQPMPFGPFLALGTVLTVVWGDTLISTYLDLFFPLGWI